MTDWVGKRYWLVGASEGLGREVAFSLSRAGAELVVSARSEDRLKALVDELPGKAIYAVLDVSDRDQVRRVGGEIGPVDGLVYLAGLYWPTKSANWDFDEVDAMSDVNFMGAQRCVGAVIGDMVERDSGHIVLTGSLSGFRGLPGTIGYGASKAAVMYLAESMQADLRKTGVRIQLINPGFVRTRLTDKNDFKMPFIMEPEDAAREFFDHMNSNDFKKSFPMMFSWLFRLSQFLPDWAYYRIFGAR